MSYLQKRRRQEKYERLQKSIAEANTLDNYSHYANGHVSGGFKEKRLLKVFGHNSWYCPKAEGLRPILVYALKKKKYIKNYW